MAILQNTLQFNGDEARTYMLEPVKELISDEGIIQFVGGIKAKQQFAYLGSMDKITQKDSGCDNPPEPRGEIPRSEKFWDPQKQEAYIKYCVEEGEGQLEQYGFATGVKYYELEAMEQKALLYNFLFQRWKEAMMRDFKRLYWFGDLDILAGALTNGAADVPNYDTVDGFWKRIGEAVTATTMNYHDITALQGDDLPDTGTPADYEAPKILKALDRMSDSRLRNLPNNQKIYLATGSIFDNLHDYYVSKGIALSQESATVKEIQGQDSLVYNGVEVRREPIWDQYIGPDFSTGGPPAVADRPHRAVYMAKNNFAVGMDINGQTTVPDYEVYYDFHNKTNHVRGRYKMDTKIAWEFLATVAY